VGGAYAAVVERCEALIAGIELPEPFDMHAFCDYLGALWGSTVALFPTKTKHNEPCGMWVSVELAGQRYDVFAYEKNAPPLHQAQMIFHEIGHCVAGHVGRTELPLSARELVARLMPNLKPDMVERILGCAREPTAYTDPRETEAEYIGSRLLDKALGWGAPLAPDAPAGLQRLHDALGSLSRG
jgi:hypothetical protein